MPVSNQGLLEKNRCNPGRSYAKAEILLLNVTFEQERSQFFCQNSPERRSEAVNCKRAFENLIVAKSRISSASRCPMA